MEKGLWKPHSNYGFLTPAKSQLKLSQHDVHLNGHRKLISAIVSVSVLGICFMMGCTQPAISEKKEKAVNNTIVTVEELPKFWGLQVLYI